MEFKALNAQLVAAAERSVKRWSTHTYAYRQESLPLSTTPLGLISGRMRIVLFSDTSVQPGTTT